MTMYRAEADYAPEMFAGNSTMLSNQTGLTYYFESEYLARTFVEGYLLTEDEINEWRWIDISDDVQALTEGPGEAPSTTRHGRVVEIEPRSELPTFLSAEDRIN